MNVLDKNSLRLSVLNDALIDDEVFADAAMQLLLIEDPTSTYTRATAGMALINYLMIERGINCYERGLIIDAASGTVFPDENGDYDTALNAVNHSRYVDADELTELIKSLDLPLPIILHNLTPQAQPQNDINNNDETKSSRRNRLYEEIEEIPNYKTIGKPAIRKILSNYINKDGSCIKSISDDSISWIDWQGDKQITTNLSLGKWLARQKQ